MKSYKEASRLPFTKIGKVTLPRLILGYLPFVGQTYQGSTKNQRCCAKFSNVQNTVRILTEVVQEHGVTVVAAPPATEGQLAKLFLQAIRKTMNRANTEIAVIPCLQIPLTIGEEPVDDYRRWLSYYQHEKKLVDEGTIEKYFTDPVLNCRNEWQNGFSRILKMGKPYHQNDLDRMEIDYARLHKAASSLQGFNILFVEPGSEIDFLTICNRQDLLSELLAWLRAEFGYPILLGTHHAGTTIPVLEQTPIAFEGYISPVNKLGVMMFPTTQMALKAIKRTEKPVIAIKPFAGGRISPQAAFPFIYKDVDIASCMIGVASEREAKEDISLALKSLNS